MRILTKRSDTKKTNKLGFMWRNAPLFVDRTRASSMVSDPFVSATKELSVPTNSNQKSLKHELDARGSTQQLFDWPLMNKSNSILRIPTWYRNDFTQELVGRIREKGLGNGYEHDDVEISSFMEDF
jgi:hypothetical protein